MGGAASRDSIEEGESHRPARDANSKSDVPLALRVRRAAGVAAGLAVLAVLLYARAVPCLFALIFRTPCPSCGATRASLALLHGDLHGVLRYNPFGPVAAALIAVLAVQAVLSFAMHGDARAVGGGRLGWFAKRAFVVLFAGQLVLWVARFFGAFGGPVPVGG